MPATPARLILAACGLALIAGPVHADGPAVHYRVMALTGTDGNLGPQLGSNVVFDSFEHVSGPVINNNGTIAFGGYLDGPGIGSSNDRALFFANQSGVTLIAQHGGTLKHLAAVFHPRVISLSDLDVTALSAVLNSGCQGTQPVISWFSQTAVSTLARSRVLGPLGPGLASNTFDIQTTRPLINAAGEVLFSSYARGISIDLNDCTSTVHHQERTDGIWFVPVGESPVPVALSNTHLPEFPDALGPGLEPEAYFASLATATSTVSGAINDHGEFTFAGSLRGVPSASRGTIFRGTVNGTELVARTGTDGPHGPGLGTGVHFIVQSNLINGSGSVRINNQRRIVFGGTTSQGRGIFVSDPGQPVHPIMLTGTDGHLGPQLGAGRPFVSSTAPFYPAVDGAGRVFFPAQVQLSGSSYPNVLAVHEAGTNRVLVMQGHTGQYGPGMGSGTSFDQLHPWFTVNEAGEMVFAAQLSGVPTNQRSSIWHSDLDHGLALVAQAGTPFEVAPGDVRIIAEPKIISQTSTASASGGQDGRPRALNDAGEMVLLLEFADGSQAIVMATVEHPDPPCYADCDDNGTLNIADFLCFIDAFASGDPYADCDESGTLNIADFLCFIDEFAQGCP